MAEKTTLQKWEEFHRQGLILHWGLGIMWAIQGTVIFWAFVHIIMHGGLSLWLGLPLVLLEIWAAYSIYKVIKNWNAFQPDYQRIRQEIINESKT